MVFFSFAVRRCKNSSPAFPLAYKSTAAVASALQKGQTATALLTCLKNSRGGFVSVVSAGCLVHFLRFINIYPISQISIKRAFRSCCIHARGYCSRRSFRLFPRRFLYLPAKL